MRARVRKVRWRWRWTPHRETPLTSHCPKVKTTRSSIHPSLHHPNEMGAKDRLSEAVISFLPWNTTIVSGANVGVNMRAASRTGVCHGMTGSIRTLSVTMTDTACKFVQTRRATGWLVAASSPLVWSCARRHVHLPRPHPPHSSFLPYQNRVSLTSPSREFLSLVSSPLTKKAQDCDTETGKAREASSPKEARQPRTGGRPEI